MKQTHSDTGVETLYRSLRQGDRNALARAITLVESRKEESRHRAAALIDMCMPHTGNARRIGISGSPGVGKSTFIETLGLLLIEQGKHVAVLSIDPSSRISGGAILGDKTRMQDLSRHEHAFIRPSAAGESLGGVAQHTREAILLCEAAGFDHIIVETVGVGQSETRVAEMVDYFILLLLPGAGDELQGIKRGIVELANLLVINKADGERLKMAKTSRSEYSRAIRLLSDPERPVPASVIMVSSLHHQGFDNLLSEMDHFFAESTQSGYLYKMRARQAQSWFDEMAQNRFRHVLFSNKRIRELYADLKDAIQSREKSVTLAIQELEQCLQETFGDS